MGEHLATDADVFPYQTGVPRAALGEPAGPCAMVIFGAGGDLTKRKLIPAVYNLAKEKLLPDHFAIVGVSLEKYSTEDFRKRLSDEVREYASGDIDQNAWEWFTNRIYYTSGDFKDPQLYQQLKDLLAQVDKDQGTQGNALFYLATSPEFFAVVAKQLGGAGLTKEANRNWRRVVI